MGHIICVTNQKGGVGKTSTASSLINGLAGKGFSTLAVDTDPQSNLTYSMNADENHPGVYELLNGSVDPLETVQSTAQGDIIPASLMLSKADIEFITAVGREYLLSKALEPLKGRYDYIVIDSPPQLGILTINALAAANDVIIPMGADTFSLQGLAQLNATITEVKRHCNQSLNVAGLLITRYSGRAILSQELRETIEEMAAQIGTGVFTSVIREGIAVKEAQTRRESLYTTAPRSNPALDYLAFAEEYIQGRRQP